MNLLRLVRTVAAATLGLLAVGFAAVPASAQTMAEFAGQWSCKYSMEPFSGNAMDKHYWEFQLALYENASYEMQGFYYNPVVGQIPVQGGGQWAITQEGNINVQGRLLRQDAGWGPFQFIAKPANARSLYLQFRGNTQMTNLTCQR